MELLMYFLQALLKAVVEEEEKEEQAIRKWMS